MKIENLSSKTSCLKHRMQMNLHFTIKRKIFKLVLNLFYIENNFNHFWSNEWLLSNVQFYV